MMMFFFQVCGKNRDVDETLSKKFKPSSPHILDVQRFFQVCGKGFKQKAHMQKHLSSHRQKGEVAGQVFWMGNPMEDPKDPKMDMDQDHIFIDQE